MEITKVIASHDLELVEALCPREIILDGGKVVVDADTCQLLVDERLLAAHGLARHQPAG